MGRKAVATNCDHPGGRMRSRRSATLPWEAILRYTIERMRAM